MTVRYWFAILFLLSACKKESTIKPEVKPLMEAVYASGFVVAEGEYQVFSQVEGSLVDKLVKDGEDVKQDQPLFIIEGDQQSSRNQLAKENYDMAAKNAGSDSPILRELSATVASAKTKMSFDSLNAARYSNLLKSNATSQVDFDRIKLTYENSKNDYVLQKSRYQKTKNQLYIELQNAKSQLQISTDERGRYTVRSEVNGKVFKTMKEKGELVRRSEALAVLGQDNTFYLQLSIDELDVHRIKKGQEVLVKIDAYPDHVFKASVAKVYSMVNAQQQSLRVDASFTEPLPGSFSGLAVEANIIIQQKQKALVIPKSILLEGDSVLIKTENGEKKIKVMLGIETLDEVEIVAGVDSDDRLIVKR
ncbi:MAG TPA: efflux RND transporter periplasmic adaptor subunit [Chryseolinea sp.]|nr:efflux RND transporter periplasmic adaptor subunit [Chryseolinea sp.]HPM30537.1 efflux RND transporter periplasmic adaptor subunit [Chryseolinea sp.]